MTITIKSNPDGVSGAIQVNGNDKVTIGANGISAGSFAPNSIDAAAAALAFSGINQSLATNGYQKLPSGLIIQWGASTPSGGNQSISLPISFPNSFLAVVPQMADTNTSAYAYVSGTKTSVSAFTLVTRNSAGTATAYLTNWIAIGY